MSDPSLDGIASELTRLRVRLAEAQRSVASLTQMSETAVNIACGERDSLKRQLDEREALVEEMHDLLEGVDTASDGEALGFDLEAVRKFLKGHKRISRKDIVLAQMRDALEMALGYIRRWHTMGRNPNAGEALWKAHRLKDPTCMVIDAALSSDAGKTALEKMRYLERGRELLAQTIATGMLLCHGCTPTHDCSPQSTCKNRALATTIDAYLKEAQE